MKRMLFSQFYKTEIVAGLKVLGTIIVSTNFLEDLWSICYLGERYADSVVSHGRVIFRQIHVDGGLSVDFPWDGDDPRREGGKRLETLPWD